MSLECETHLRGGDTLHTIANHMEALYIQDGSSRKKSIILWESKQVIIANRVETIEVNIRQKNVKAIRKKKV